MVYSREPGEGNRYRRAFRRDSSRDDRFTDGLGDFSEGAMRASEAVSEALDALGRSVQDEVEAGYEVAERFLRRGPLGRNGYRGPRAGDRVAGYSDPLSGSPLEAMQLGQRFIEAAIDAAEAVMTVATDYSERARPGQRDQRPYYASPPPGFSSGAGSPQWAERNNERAADSGRAAPGEELTTTVELFVGEGEHPISGRCELTPFVGIGGEIAPHHADIEPLALHIQPGQSQQVAIRLAVPARTVPGRYSARLRAANGAFESEPLVIDIG